MTLFTGSCRCIRERGALLLIDHRVNTAAHLARVPLAWGCEIDLRDYDGEIVLTHDPLQGGETLREWIQGYQHNVCIFNVKCDGLEDRIMKIATEAGLQNFFFLDCANPTLIKLARRGEKRLAVRFSEFEPIENALAFAGRAEWVWVDCFTHLPLDAESHQRLKKHFKICLVSPELQGHGRETIAAFKSQLKNMPIDAVCSDFCEDWAEA